MDSITTILTFLFVICASIILEVICSGASYSANNQPLPPLNANSNAWPRLSNQSTYNVNPSWQNSGQTTTPWPELGQRRRNHNQNQHQLNQNAPTWVRPATQSVQNVPTPWPELGQRGRNQNQQNQNVPTWVRPTTQSAGTRLVNSSDSRGAQQQLQQNQNDVQDNELREFSESLLQKDVNNAARFVTINYQGKTTSGSKNDEAPQPLLSVQKDAYNIPTVAKLALLHNNYILETNVNEHVSPQERQEENDLLDALLSTQVMQLTKNFLISKGKIGRDPREFRDILKEIWFNMYSRGGGRIGSSGFEHVFVAELKNKAVSGLHNWIYFNDQEAKHEANYLGHLKKVELGNKGAILKLHFKFHDVDKPVGSMFIGTSPELEMALYSTCFLLRADRVCPLRLAGNNFIIRTYTYRYRGKNLIGSAFPEI